MLAMKLGSEAYMSFLFGFCATALKVDVMCGDLLDIQGRGKESKGDLA